MCGRGGGRMSKWVRGGRKGGWDEVRAQGDGVGKRWGGKMKKEGWCECVWRGVFC